jgi:hypothetical protein
MGDVVLFPGVSTRKSIDALLMDIAEHALHQNGIAYARETKPLPETTLVASDEKYVGIQDILSYTSQNSKKTPSIGLPCRKAQLYMTEFVRKENSISNAERADIKSHLITGCEECFRHLETECTLYDTTKSIGRQRN